MNTVHNVLRSLHICKACFQAALYRVHNSQVRHFSSLYLSRYNSKEQKQILQILNESTAEEMSRFDVSKGRINSLQQFRRKRGQFCTLDEVLEVDGLGVKVLERLCDSILNQISGSEMEMSVEMSQVQKWAKPTKSHRSQLLTPTLHFDQKKAVQSAVGIHIGVSALTWAHIDVGGTLIDWDLYSLEFGSKKLHITSLFEVAQSIYDTLPKAELFIMEDNGSSSLSLQQQPSSVAINFLTSQLTALLVALLNNSPLPGDELHFEHQHRVFFLRSQLPARLFGVLVGAERVSAQTVVLDILSEAQKNSTTESDRGNQTANIYTPINVRRDLVDRYFKRTSVEKESLCSSLLLTIAFMNLVIHQDPYSLKTVNVKKSL